jgi:hypothetical protein
LALAVPLELDPTEHVSPVGWVRTVTAYAPPFATTGVKAKVPSDVTERLLALLFCNTTVAPLERPVTDALIVKVVVPPPVLLRLPPPHAVKPNIAATVTISRAQRELIDSSSIWGSRRGITSASIGQNW